jgi:hypothetical protein
LLPDRSGNVESLPNNALDPRAPASSRAQRSSVLLSATGVVRGETAKEANRDIRAASVSVFVFFLCLYVLTLKGVSTGDDLLHYDPRSCFTHRV